MRMKRVFFNAADSTLACWLGFICTFLPLIAVGVVFSMSQWHQMIKDAKHTKGWINHPAKIISKSGTVQGDVPAKVVTLQYVDASNILQTANIQVRYRDDVGSVLTAYVNKAGKLWIPDQTNSQISDPFKVHAGDSFFPVWFLFAWVVVWIVVLGGGWVLMEEAIRDTERRIPTFKRLPRRSPSAFRMTLRTRKVLVHSPSGELVERDVVIDD